PAGPAPPSGSASRAIPIPTRPRSSAGSPAERTRRTSFASSACAGCWSPPTASAASASSLEPALTPKGVHHVGEPAQRGLRLLEAGLEHLPLQLLLLKVLMYGLQRVHEHVDGLRVLARVAGEVLDGIASRGGGLRGGRRPCRGPARGAASSPPPPPPIPPPTAPTPP